MNTESLREYCLSLPGTEESLPFGPDTLVFKVGGKVYLLTPLDGAGMQFNAKCNPEKAEELRLRYSDVQPGYHMNKKHWNTVFVTGSIPSEMLLEWVKDSYDLVFQSLPRKEQQRIEQEKA